MRSADVLVTKPSELAFYPIPKLFIRRVGGHEQWGAVHSAELGDGTLECRDIEHTIQMLDLFLRDPGMLESMCHNIVNNKKLGIYDGAYKVVEAGGRKRHGIHAFCQLYFILLSGYYGGECFCHGCDPYGSTYL